ncbi:MAG TPA: amino acid ABC transporter permease [Candidatus Dormibacteraeota bacterium]
MSETAAQAVRPEAITAVPVRHPLRWLGAVLVLAIFAGIVYKFVTAPRLRWDVVAYWFFQHSVLQALVLTIVLTVIAMAIGVVLGTVLAVMRLSPNPVLSSVSWFYIFFFRGTPVLVQLWFWWNLQLILPTLAIGIPGTPLIWSADTVKLITPLVAAILGLGLNEAAYMAEIVRAGVISIDQGQTEAAQALGMRRVQIMRRIILPQAMRVVIPPTGNESISMLKTSSLASIVTLTELFRVSQAISAYNYRVEELLIVVSIWYLLCTSVMTVGQYYLERYYARGSVRQLPETPVQRIRRLLFTTHQTPPILAETGAAPL